MLRTSQNFVRYIDFKPEDAMRAEYFLFLCSEPQYKRRFGTWKLRKNISTAKKTAIYEKLHTRAQLGKSSLVTYKGQDVDPGKFRRLVKTKKRQSVGMGTFMGPGFVDIESLSGHALQCGNMV